MLQLIATFAGGLKEFADGKKILVMRTDNGRQVAYTFDYREMLKGRNLRQNIELKPGDTVGSVSTNEAAGIRATPLQADPPDCGR